MTVSRRTVLLAASGTSLILAGCLGDDDDDADDVADDTADDDVPADDTADDADDDPGEPADVTIDVADHDTYGEILVDAEGMTLYNFDADPQGEGESTCYDDCADDWPPLTVTDEPTASDDVTAELTTFERDDGETQVAADGWPLYYFAGDSEPGDTTGQGVNDVWWVLAPDGSLITDEPDDDEDDDYDDDGDDDGGGGYGY